MFGLGFLEIPAQMKVGTTPPVQKTEPTLTLGTQQE